MKGGKQMDFRICPCILANKDTVNFKIQQKTWFGWVDLDSEGLQKNSICFKEHYYPTIEEAKAAIRKLFGERAFINMWEGN